MPETPDPKLRLHPFRAPPETAPVRLSPPTPYAELQVATNFTFLTGASHPDELVWQAARLGHRAIAITDTNTLAGVVRAHIAAREIGIQLMIGCRLVFEKPIFDGQPLSILVYPTERPAYAGLCRLLTLGKRRAEKAQCKLMLPDLVEHQRGLLAVVLPPGALTEDFVNTLAELRRIFDDDRLSLAACRDYGPDDRTRLNQLSVVSRHSGVPLVAVNHIHYHLPERRPLQDVVTCIRLGCTIDQAGKNLLPHGEFHLKPPDEMARLFSGYPRAISRTVEIARRASGFSLDQLRYEYPEETCPGGLTPQQHLMDLAWKGAAGRYPAGIPEKVRAQIAHELALIEELDYSRYFLTVHDIVVYARSLGILCQGRGAAANSAVCYCLGVTSVDPDRIDLLFERFVSRERKEPPDIDIDFEHERREEVIQYLYRKYGRDRAALTAEVITYRGRSAVREVGKAMGLSLDCVDRLAKSLDWWDAEGVKPERLAELGLNPEDPTLRKVIVLTHLLLGFPRHLSQHVGGFVMTRTPLCELVPIENAAMEDRTVIEWDKDDIDALGMLKVDVLGLGMLTAIRKAFDLVEGLDPRRLELHTIPPEEPAVYDAICHADTIGVFQIESRAQMAMLPRLKPRCFYDLVIEVAIVRPGPIQGNMVHPYLRRRSGEEKVTYPNKEVEAVLKKTLGVPLFQEQAMTLAMVAAGFTADEADQLRRAMAAWKRKGDLIYRFGQRLVDGMLARGYPREFAERCFEQIKGFSEYGFPESHAASFALLVYVSSWLKVHHPAAFAGALINSQPMGFYAPAQIVRDAREHGVGVRPVDVNLSGWDCRLEDSPPALRLGFRLVKHLGEAEGKRIEEAVKAHGPLPTVESLWRASGAKAASMRALAAADAFNSMGLDRQQALWQVRALRDEELPIFETEEASAREISEDPAALPAISADLKVRHDYASVGLSLKAHPMSFIREELDRRRITRAGELQNEAAFPNGTPVAVAGVVLVRQRPGTASGIVFFTIEDETGVANLIVRPHIYDRDRRAARHSVAILARGTIERQGEVVHILAKEIEALDLRGLSTTSRDFH